MNQDLQTKAIQIIDQVTEGFKAAAPQMADITLAAVKFQAYFQLANGLLATCGLIVSGWFGYKFIKWLWSLEDTFDRDIHKVFTCIVYGIVLFVLAIASLNLLTDTYTWAAIIDPRMAIALKVISKAGM